MLGNNFMITFVSNKEHAYARADKNIRAKY